MIHVAVSPSTELAKAYLQSNFPKDSPVSDELTESLWNLAGEAALQGNMELSYQAMERMPMDAAFFFGVENTSSQRDRDANHRGHEHEQGN